MSALVSVKGRLSGHPTSAERRIGPRMIKLNFGLIFNVLDVVKAQNAKHAWHAHGWRQESTFKGQALNASQLAPADLIYRVDL